jgi:hypothetical protein
MKVIISREILKENKWWTRRFSSKKRDLLV